VWLPVACIVKKKQAILGKSVRTQSFDWSVEFYDQVSRDDRLDTMPRTNVGGIWIRKSPIHRIAVDVLDVLLL